MSSKKNEILKNWIPLKKNRFLLHQQTDDMGRRAPTITRIVSLHYGVHI